MFKFFSGVWKRKSKFFRFLTAISSLRFHDIDSALPDPGFAQQGLPDRVFFRAG
jgi:hypothetical protein